MITRMRPLIRAAVASAAMYPLTVAVHAAPPTVLYEPDMRSAVFINFAPRLASPGNPYGYQRMWHKADTAEQWMRSQLARGDRIIIRTPFGNAPEGLLTSKQWYVAANWRRELFVRVINHWLAANPKRTFSLYVGTLVGDPHDRAMTDTRSPSPDDPEAMRDFLATVRPWLRVTKVHRLWLDHSSGPPDNRRNVLALARWCREHLDLTVGMEAYPRNGKTLDVEAMRALPTLATWRFAETFDKEGVWRTPAGCEVLLIIIPQKQSPTPTPATVAAYRRCGFIIGSGHFEYDRMVRQVNAQPVEAPPE